METYRSTKKPKKIRLADIDPTCNVAEVQLSYKNIVPASQMVSVTSSRDAVEVLRPFFEPSIDHRELFYAILLNRANKVLGVIRISEGGVVGTVADPRLILQAAILANASGIILAHNHPSGNLNPSEADISMTQKIKEGARLVDIALLDHVIVRGEDNCHYSFANEGKFN